jgi:hypothetical protein
MNKEYKIVQGIGHHWNRRWELLEKNYNGIWNCVYHSKDRKLVEDALKDRMENPDNYIFKRDVPIELLENYDVEKDGIPWF